MSSAIYSRILARLEPPVLQRHCSLVFEDELQAISAELREIVAAYARLQEVREAVAALENGRADVRRSASLMATVESTAKMQEELMDRMRLVERVLHSRPAMKLGGEERYARESIKTEDRAREKPTKTEKEKKTKRRRRDSTTDDEEDPKQEEKEVEHEQPEPGSPVKKSKKAKMKTTTQYESAAMETRKTLVSSSWSSASSGPTVETESEAEQDQRPVKRNSIIAPTIEDRHDDWIQWLHQAIGQAQKGLNQGAPSGEQVALVVDLLCGIMDTVIVPDDRKASSLANGQFNNLIVLTIRLLKKTAQDPMAAPLAATILQSIEDAIARDAKLEDLRKHLAELNQIRNKVAASERRSSKPEPESAQHKVVTPAEAKESTFDWPMWRERVAELLRTSSSISASGHALLFTEVSAFSGTFRDTLQMLSKSTATNMNASTRDEFFSVVASAPRVFQCPGVTKPFIPLLNKVMFAIDDVIKLHSRFNSLRSHSQNLLAIRSGVTNTQQEDRQKSAVSATASVNASQASTLATESVDKEHARFEGLVSIADELLALKLSERRGRVSKHVVTLQKELNLVFPTKGKRLTPSRTAYEAIADAVKKAIEVIQDEPHTEQNDTIYRQFLELLYSIGGRYNMFKQIIARSRDDLYLYLYPNATPSSKQQNSKSKSTQAQNNTPSSGSSHQDDENSLHEQLQAAYKKAHSWDHDVFSLKEFDEVMRVLRGVMAVNSKTWRVRRDHSVSACLTLMSQRAHAIKKKEHREGRLASLEQWQKLMEV